MKRSFANEVEVVTHAASSGEWDGIVQHYEGRDSENQEFQKFVDDNGLILVWKFELPQEFHALWRTTYTASVLQKMQSLKAPTSPKV